MKDVSNKELMKLHDSNIVAGWSIQSFNAAIKTRELILSKLTAGEEAVKKIAELRDEVERLKKREADYYEFAQKQGGVIENLRQQAAAGQIAVDAMEKFSNKYKQWVSDYPKVVQKSKFFDDLIEMLQHKEAL